MKKIMQTVFAVVLFVLIVAPLQAGIYLDIKDTTTFRLTNTPTDESFVLLLSGRDEQRTLPEPDAVQDAVRRAAATHRLPQSLLLAIIRGGRSVGNGGIMVLPEFAVEHLTDTEIYDPAVNIREGAERLQEMLDHFRGNLTLALAAYKAGIEEVEGVGGVPPGTRASDFVEHVKAAFDNFEKRSEIIYSYRDEKGILTLINIR